MPVKQQRDKCAVGTDRKLGQTVMSNRRLVLTKIRERLIGCLLLVSLFYLFYVCAQRTSVKDGASFVCSMVSVLSVGIRFLG